MKKQLLVLSIVSIALGTGFLNACQLTVVNDIDVAVKLEAREPIEGFETELVIKAGDAKNFGNPNQHANLTIYEEVSPGKFEPRKIIMQHACSKEHAITVHVSDLFENRIDEGLFNMHDPE